ncbi:MAG TPA: glycosyltransferase family 2 protein, partial [Solirubrobacterales bacterium]|nr:glycosyltransferase family 2 protein [Solirubrobacterales bacterium]
LAMCEGEFVGVLDHDDTLTPDALLRVAQVLAADPELDVVYSDSDKLTLKGIRADPFLKPDWSPVYALGAMYIGHLLVVRYSLAEAAGGFDSGFDTIQDFEFMLRVCERTERIHHIPQILYHWRAIPGSIAAGTDQKDGVPELQARAVSEHLERLGAPARAVPHGSIPHRAVLRPARTGNPQPKVSVVIAATRSQPPRRLLASLAGPTDYPDLERIVVAGPGAELDGEQGVTVVEAPERLGRPAANNLGAERASGEYLLFVSSEAEAVEADWLSQLVLHAALPKVEAVGPRLVGPDGRVDQAGVAIGLGDPASPMLRGYDAEGDGYYGSLPCSRDVSALAADCLLVERAAFEREAGFSELYALRYEDYDLCQRLRAQGGRCVYAAPSKLLINRDEARDRAEADVVDRALFVDTWYDELRRGDQFYNPAFAQERADYVPGGWRDRVYRATYRATASLRAR